VIGGHDDDRPRREIEPFERLERPPNCVVDRCARPGGAMNAAF
jgi:hypothetical protein